MIIQYITESMFIQSFIDMDRKENFTHSALRELYDYYNELSDDVNQPFELDVIAICCEWSEYTADELENEYQHLIDVGNYDDDDECFDGLLDELRDNTTLIEVSQYGEPNTYLVMGF